MDLSTEQSTHEVLASLHAHESTLPQESLSNTNNTSPDPVSDVDTLVIVPAAPADNITVNAASSQPAQEVTQPTLQLKFGPYSDRTYSYHQSYRLSHDELREIAVSTLDALDDGFYYPPSTQVPDLSKSRKRRRERNRLNQNLKLKGEWKWTSLRKVEDGYNRDSEVEIRIQRNTRAKTTVTRKVVNRVRLNYLDMGM